MNLRTTCNSSLPPEQHNKNKIHELSLYCGNINWYNYLNTLHSIYSSWIYMHILQSSNSTPKEILTDIQQKSHMRTFVDAPFIIEWTGAILNIFKSRMDRLWNICTMKYSVTTRTNNLQPYGTISQTLGIKWSQTEHRLYYPLMSSRKTGKTKIRC